MNRKINNNIVHSLRQRKLIFDKENEDLFLDDYYQKSIFITRLALILGIILYSSFGILDAFLAPESKETIWIIRFAIVLPVLVITLILSYFKLFKNYMQFIMSVVSVVAGFGIIAMIIISGKEDSAIFYYAGLILVIMWSYTFTRLRFKYATIACWIVVFGYEYIAIFEQGMLQSEKIIKVFINNNFFFISANILGMFVCYLMEWYARKDFYQRQMISKNREEILQERNELSTRNEIMKKELHMARIIQEQLIPKNNPNESFFSLYRPMQEIGGDLYDFIKIHSNNKIGIFLSDVSGHGVPAALITSMVKSILVDSAQTLKTPADVLKHLNDILIHQTEDNFITAFYGIYDPVDRSIIYSNAGHHPPYVVFKSKLVRLDKVKSIPLAILDNSDLLYHEQNYRNSKAILPENSKLILFTDGIVEATQHDIRDRSFGKIFTDKMIEYRKSNSEDFVNNMYNDLVKFHGNDNFDDDICLICMSI